MKRVLQLILTLLLISTSMLVWSETNSKDFEKAIKLYYEGKYWLALEILEKRQLEEPKNGRLFFILGNIYTQKSDWLKAIDAYERSYELYENNDQVKKLTLYNLAQTYRYAKEYAKSTIRYLKLLELTNEYPLSYLFIAINHYSLKDCENTIKYLELFIKNAPSHEQAPSAKDSLEKMKKNGCNFAEDLNINLNSGNNGENGSNTGNDGNNTGNNGSNTGNNGSNTGNNGSNTGNNGSNTGNNTGNNGNNGSNTGNNGSNTGNNGSNTGNDGSNTGNNGSNTGNNGSNTGNNGSNTGNNGSNTGNNESNNGNNGSNTGNNESNNGNDGSNTGNNGSNNGNNTGNNNNNSGNNTGNNNNNNGNNTGNNNNNNGNNSNNNGNNNNSNGNDGSNGGSWSINIKGTKANLLGSDNVDAGDNKRKDDEDFDQVVM